jgi:Large extracellular alpha-helical protein
MNFTKFTDLPGGEFDICILTQNIVYPIKRVYVSENKSIAEEIYMEPLIEELNMYFSGYMAGGGAYAEDMALTKQGARNENAPSPDEENSSATVQVRENFVDSPFWAPSVITDRSGEATVSFNLPDNLTSWRSTVRVITKDTKTGEAVNNVIATKNLLVRLETPRFFKEGDTTMVVANIHNYLNTDAETKVKFSFTNLTPVSFDVKGVTVSKKTTDSFEAVISSKGIATVEIKTAVPFVNYNSELYIEAISDKESDALKIQVPVIP